MNMKNRILFSVAVVLFSISSTVVLGQKTASKTAVPKGFTKSPNDLYYQFLRCVKGGKACHETDIVSFRAKYSVQRGDKDSLIFDTKNNPGGIIQLQLSRPEYKGDLMEGLMMMHQGDSAFFLVPADSFFIKTVRVEKLPGFVKPGERVRFEIGMVEVNTLSEMQQKQAVQDSIAQIEMKTQREKEMAVVIAKAQELGSTNAPEPSGLVIIRRQAGNGIKPTVGQKVHVHYTGTLLNGTVFDSSIERKEPIAFTLGRSEVIKGWDEGIAALEIGGKATLVIPSWLAYGARSMGPIPSNSTLVFEVELVKVE
jgi:FKBP-type peptidyl-prolyl cis-trans isomerase